MNNTVNAARGVVNSHVDAGVTQNVNEIVPLELHSLRYYYILYICIERNMNYSNEGKLWLSRLVRNGYGLTARVCGQVSDV